jgi:hypothetical protein
MLFAACSNPADGINGTDGKDGADGTFYVNLLPAELRGTFWKDMVGGTKTWTFAADGKSFIRYQSGGTLNLLVVYCTQLESSPLGAGWTTWLVGALEFDGYPYTVPLVFHVNGTTLKQSNGTTEFTKQ